MRVPRSIQELRDREFAAATTAAEVSEMIDRWTAEDRAAARAQSVESKRIAAVERRISKLERCFDALPEMLGEVVGEERVLAAARLAKALQEHAGMSYCGVHDPARGYVTGSVVTAKSGLWIATDVAPAGDKPGRSPSWRLIVKGRVEDPSLA